MDQQDRIDLSSVNKTKKQFKLPKITNPFKKKSAGPGRDAEGKFTSGSGGLINNKKFNAKRAVPLALVVALVGGFFVFRSFASVTPPPAYQYSIATCATIKDTSKPSKCHDESAEALAYRLQVATLGRQSDWGYKNLTQQLAGDRKAASTVSSVITNTPEARWGGLSNKDYVDKVAGLATVKQRAEWTKLMDQKKLSRDQLAENIAALFKISKNRAMMPSYRYNNKQFVENIFKKLLKRGDAFVASANDTWLKALNEEKRTRANTVLAIAQSQEAKNKTRADMIKYVRSNPKIKVVQTAKTKQNARNSQLAALVSSAKTHYEKGSLHHQQLAAKLPAQASAKAGQSRITRANLTEIENLQKDAQNRYNHAQTSANNANKDLKKAEALLKEAKVVTKHSPDISSSTAELSTGKIAIYAASAKNKSKDASSYITRIANSYKTAATKYENQCNSGTDYNGQAPGCGSAPAPSGGGSGGSSSPGTAITQGPCAGMSLTACEARLRQEQSTANQSREIMNCYNRSGSSETRKIDGGRTTQKRSYSWQWNNGCNKVYGPWATTGTVNGSTVNPQLKYCKKSGAHTFYSDGGTWRYPSQSGIIKVTKAKCDSLGGSWRDSTAR
jgi:hypothetical protein